MKDSVRITALNNAVSPYDLTIRFYTITPVNATIGEYICDAW